MGNILRQLGDNAFLRFPVPDIFQPIRQIGAEIDQRGHGDILDLRIVVKPEFPILLLCDAEACQRVHHQLDVAFLDHVSREKDGAVFGGVVAPIGGAFLRGGGENIRQLIPGRRLSLFCVKLVEHIDVGPDHGIEHGENRALYLFRLDRIGRIALFLRDDRGIIRQLLHRGGIRDGGRGAGRGGLPVGLGLRFAFARLERRAVGRGIGVGGLLPERGLDELRFERLVEMAERLVGDHIVIDGALLHLRSEFALNNGIRDRGFRFREISAARDQHDAGQHKTGCKGNDRPHGAVGLAGLFEQ